MTDVDKGNINEDAGHCKEILLWWKSINRSLSILSSSVNLSSD